jgi:hypothetical protein
MRPETLKQSQEVVGNILEQIGIGNICPQNGRKSLPAILSRGSNTRIYKEFNIPMKKWAHELNREFSKQEVQMPSKYMKKYSTSLAIKEMQIKDTQIPSHPS